MQRRTFVKQSLAAGASMSVAPMIITHGHSASDSINIGFIGTGLRGRNHIGNLLRHPGVRSTAFCDIDPDAVEKTRKLYQEHGHDDPKVYTGDPEAFRRMLEEETLDAVLVATNWLWHTPIVVAAMEAGVYTACEVSGASSVEECWEWVHAHERTGTHLMFLENVCYRRDVMAVLNMIRDHVFGELLHCRGGYLHDLRGIKFDDGQGGLAFGEGAVGEARWRTKHSLHRNGDLYPTHGLGPIATMLDINRGNRFVRLTSAATKARSLNQYVLDHPDGGKDHPYAHLPWQLGDVVTSTITTARGETIILTHDTNSPRPYSLGFRVQGTHGLIDFDYGTRRIFVEGKSPAHQWEEAQTWLDQYDHALWKKDGEKAVNAGHGGMDYFLDQAFAESVRRELPPPLDVYDAAALKVITPLSEASIRDGGAPQDIPDFTGGRWLQRPPVFGLNEAF